MKTIQKYLSIIILLLSMLLTSCSDFLQVTPTDFVTPENYFNNEKEANIAIAGVYKPLNSLYGNFFKGSFSSVTDEECFSRLSGEAVKQKIHNALTPDIATAWNTLYQGVYYANFFLDNIDKINATDSTKNSLRAEARFMRGYYYYHLAMLWGDVPLRLKPINSPLNTSLAQSPRKVVFDTICADMEYATLNLYKYTKRNTTVRICREAAIGILARVYLSRAGILNEPEYFTKARDILLPLVNSNTIKLIPDYTQIWKNISADAYDNINKEILFDVEFNADPTKFLTSGWAGNVSPAAKRSDNVTVGYNIQWSTPTITLWQYYQSDKNDVRYSWNISSDYIDANGNKVAYAAYTSNGSNVLLRCAGKFRRDWEVVSPKDKNANGSNFPILRYSDVLLMLSEAEFESNGGVVTDLALAGVDSVRSRAKAFKYSLQSTRPTADEFREIIHQERARELCFESTTRYYDLLRWGILLDKFNEVGTTLKSLGSTTSTNSGTKGDAIAAACYFSMLPHMLLFPIPYSEIQLNPQVTQNQGW